MGDSGAPPTLTLPRHCTRGRTPQRAQAVAVANSSRAAPSALGDTATVLRLQSWPSTD